MVFAFSPAFAYLCLGTVYMEACLTEVDSARGAGSNRVAILAKCMLTSVALGQRRVAALIAERDRTAVALLELLAVVTVAPVVQANFASVLVARFALRHASTVSTAFLLAALAVVDGPALAACNLPAGFAHRGRATVCTEMIVAKVAASNWFLLILDTFSAGGVRAHGARYRLCAVRTQAFFTALAKEFLITLAAVAIGARCAAL